MFTLSYQIRSEEKTPFESHAKCLVLEVGGGMVSVLLWDKAAGRPEAAEVFTGLPDHADYWKDLLTQSALLVYRDLDTVVFYNHPRFLATPSVFYHPGDATHQLMAFFGEENALYTAGDVLPGLDMMIAWEVPLAWQNELSAHFNAVQFKSLATLVLEDGFVQPGEGVEGRLHVAGNLVWLAVWRNRQLLIIKSIPADHSDNIAYQILNICSQWGLDVENMKWQVSGVIEQHSRFWSVLARFFKNFLPDNHSAGFEDSEIPPHFFAPQIRFLQKFTQQG